MHLCSPTSATESVCCLEVDVVAELVLDGADDPDVDVREPVLSIQLTAYWLSVFCPLGSRPWLDWRG